MKDIKKGILKNTRRVVIKVGTSVLGDGNNRLNSAVLENIVNGVCGLKERGLEVLLVSSGAIGAGMGILGLKKRPTQLSRLQAVAAVGQGQLMKAYTDFFKSGNKAVAQVLLTQDDFSCKKRFLNAKHTLETLLAYRVVPIINENDTIATEEIKFTDNDKLSALVAGMMKAHLLLILTDVDGLYEAGPAGHNRHIDFVEKITAEIERLAGGTSKQASLGGMVTKLKAAKAVTASGIACIIANGRTQGIIEKVLDGENAGTLFKPRGR